MLLLRSWNYFCTTFYKYAAPLVLPLNGVLAPLRLGVQFPVFAADRRI